MSDLDLTYLETLVSRHGRGKEAVIPILQGIQEHYRYVPEEALRRVCELTEITPAAITGVATFYDFFRHRPVGQHVIRICHGTACHVKGAELIHDALARALHIPAGGDTDPEGVFTIEKVACLGCCTLAPVLQIGPVTYGHLTPQTVPGVLRDYLELEKRRAAGAKVPETPRQPNLPEIRVGLGSCCVARGSAGVREALEAAVAELGVPVVVKRVGCVGMCHQTPLVEIVPTDGPPSLYAQVRPQDARAIILRHFKPRGVARRVGVAVSHTLEHLLTDRAWAPVERYGIEVRDPPVAAFLGRQRHIATEHCGKLDPTDLDEYLACEGFQTLRQVLSKQTPRQVIEAIEESGLRGRGGAGFPTGAKWLAVRAAAGAPKYVVCNGDEGDPGAFMDRMILESYPYRVIEGMAIAAYAVGAHAGYFYIRAEYPLAVERVREALRQCRERGLLGASILDSGFAFDLKIMEGAGAFVCGEETGLLASIEGRRGMPRLRPPFPAQSGLWGKPTLVNNVETFAQVSWILRNGPALFAKLGTPRSTGTKVFALAGKVARGGLIEVPMGITLRQVVEEIGGGVPEPPPPAAAAAAAKPGAGSPPPLPRRFKAVQIGGPSGGCVPAELDHITVDYEALTAAGSMMGSGGMVVLDEDDCMVDIARYFLQFTQEQSCGKCSPCRVGTRRMLDIMERLCRGEGAAGDLEELERLAVMVKRTSLCGLGKTAPNPILSTLRYFRSEYEAHLQKRCPAGRCRALIHYRITDDCIGCTLCAQNCPADAIPMKPYEKHEIDDAKCIRCNTCKMVCPVAAVVVE